MAFGPTRKPPRPDVILVAVVGAAVAFAGGRAQAFPPEDPPCPTSRLTLEQRGLAPFPNQCDPTTCLVSFKGYQWWTSYQVPFFNGGLHTPFAPKHAFLDGDGNLHLKANNDIDLGAGKVWSGGEAVLMFDRDGFEANLGYGNYLVTARLVSGSWAALDPNMAFGVFLYENPATGPHPNRPREIDLAEISRWGWNHTGECPIRGNNGNFPNNILCKGNAQFALQEIIHADREEAPLMVDRYDIGNNDEVTLVMRWHHGKKVTFEKYSGAHPLNRLPPGRRTTPGRRTQTRTQHRPISRRRYRTK